MIAFDVEYYYYDILALELRHLNNYCIELKYYYSKHSIIIIYFKFIVKKKHLIIEKNKFILNII